MIRKKINIAALALAILLTGIAVLTAAPLTQGEDQAGTEAQRELGEIISKLKVKLQTESPEEVVKMAEDLLGNFIEKYEGQKEEAEARITLGQVYTGTGNNSKAIRQYELALEDSGGMETREKALLRFYLASSYVQNSEFEKAESVYQKILAGISPGDTRIKEAVDKEMKMLETRKKLTPGSPAISFPDDAENLSGDEIAISDFSGKVVLIDFWATWCKPCIMEMPNVKKLYDEYHDDGFEIIGVSLDRSRENLASYVEKNDIEWPQIYDGPGGRIATSYAVTAIPSTILLNREGEIVKKDLRGKALEDAVGRLFKKD